MSDAYIHRLTLLPSIGTLPRPRSSSHIIQNEHRVLVFGGVGHHNVLNDMHMFDMQSRRWTEVYAKNPPVGRGGACHCFYDGKWFIFSGRALTHYCADLQVLDFRTLTWDSLKTQSIDGFSPSPRDDAGYCLFRDTMLVLGGVREDGSILRDLWCLHLPTATWSCPRVHGPCPSATAALSLCIWESEDSVLTFGGYNGTIFTADVSILHLPTATWSAVDVARVHVPTARTHACTAIHGRDMYLLGGYVGVQPQNDCWALNLYSWAWIPIVLPGNFVPRGATAALYYRGQAPAQDTLLLFGGCTGENFLNELVSLEFDGVASPVVRTPGGWDQRNDSAPPKIVLPRVGSASPEKNASERRGSPDSPRVNPDSPAHPPAKPLDASTAKMNSELKALQATVDGLRSEVRQVRSNSPHTPVLEERPAKPLDASTAKMNSELKALQAAVDGLRSEVRQVRSNSPRNPVREEMMLRHNLDVERYRLESSQFRTSEDFKALYSEMERMRQENAHLKKANLQLAADLSDARQDAAKQDKLRMAGESALLTLLDMQVEMEAIKKELDEVRIAARSVVH